MIDLFIALWLAMAIALDFALNFEIYKIQTLLKTKFNLPHIILERKFLLINFLFLFPLCLIVAPHGIYKFTFYSETIRRRLFLLLVKMAFEKKDDDD